MLQEAFAIADFALNTFDWIASLKDERAQAGLSISELQRQQTYLTAQKGGLDELVASQIAEMEAQYGDVAAQLAITKKGALAQTGYIRASADASIAETQRRAALAVQGIKEEAQEGVASTVAGGAASGLTGEGSIMALSRRIMDVAGRQTAGVRAQELYATEAARREANYQIGAIERDVESAELAAAGTQRGLTADIYELGITSALEKLGLETAMGGNQDVLDYLEYMGYEPFDIEGMKAKDEATRAAGEAADDRTPAKQRERREARNRRRERRGEIATRRGRGAGGYV